MRKIRFLAVLLTLCMLLAALPQVFAIERDGEGTLHYYGDVNFDEKINTADATLQLKYAASMIIFTADKELALTGEGYMKADANKDNLINTADAAFILKVSADMISPNTYSDEVTDFTVSFSSGSISESYASVPADRTAKAGETFTVMDIAIAQGHEFQGWKADFDGCMYKTGSSFVMPAKNVILTALWDNETAPLPSSQPTSAPTGEPTEQPTPTQEPTPTPTQAPTPTPTQAPTPTPDAIEIATKEDFLKIGTDSAYNMNKKYVLTADIDMGGEVLVPRGYVNGTWTSFKGKFDGQGHKIYNFRFDTSIDCGGLFWDNQGMIQNLYADCSPCTITAAYAGMIAYENTVTGQIRGCGASGKMSYTQLDGWVGGIVSWNEATIDQCWSNCEIEVCTTEQSVDEYYVYSGFAGLITSSNYNGTITNCAVFGSVKGMYVGAIYGENMAGQGTGNVSNCYSLAKVDFYYDSGFFNPIGFVPVVYGQMYYTNGGGFFFLKGQSYNKGEIYTGADNRQYTDKYYGYALENTQFNQSMMSMYEAGIWDFSGQYPILKYAAGMAQVTVAPYAD